MPMSSAGAYVTSAAAVWRRKSGTKAQRSPTYPRTGRLFRLVFEIALFCVLFYFVTVGIVITMNWLGTEMADAEGKIDMSGKGFRMFTYIGALVVALLTIKLRFQSGK